MKVKKKQFFFLLFVVSLYVPEALAEEGNTLTFGSPDAVENQIASDRAQIDPLYSSQLLAPYFEFQTQLKEDFGLAFSLDYTHVYIKASEKLEGAEDQAGGGIVRFFGAWDLVGRESGNTGALVWKGEHRHRSANIPPKDLSFETGYVGLFEPPFSNDGLRLTNLYWRQRIVEPRITITAGFLDATDYVDAFALGSPWLHFMNFAFSTGSATIDLPNDSTLGIAAGAMLTDNIYLIGGVTNANADPTDPFDVGFETLDQSEFFKSFELGWTSSADRIILDNFHLTYWHIDEREDAGIPDGWGLNFSASYFVTDTWMPFLRGGYTEDSGSLLERSVSVGVGYQPAEHRNRNLLGFAFNWGEPNETSFGSGLDDQYAFELFYRYQLTKELAITPDIQYIIDPALNPDDSSVWYFGIRGRIAL